MDPFRLPVKNRILYISLPILLAAVMSVMSVFLWEGYHSLFFVVGLALNTLAMGYFNPQNLRKSILLTSSLILIYNLFIPSIGGAINEVVAISSAAIGLIRNRKKTACDRFPIRNPCGISGSK
jgi:hypothetical protein